MKKREIRTAIKLLNTNITEAQKREEASAVTEQLNQLILRTNPSVVAAFMPLFDEIGIDINRLAALCRVVVPRITADESGVAEMEFFDYKPTEISAGAYGINEPQGATPCAAEDIDLMILPGVAFTPQGDRLGRGKGFYDRYTAREGFRALCVGVCYRHQLIDRLPVEPHDRRADIVITADTK